MSKFESNKYLYIYRQKNTDRCYIIDYNDKLLPPQSSYLKAFYFVDWYYIQNFQFQDCQMTIFFSILL